MAKRPTSQPNVNDPTQPKQKRVRKPALAAPERADSRSTGSIGRPPTEPTLDDIRRRAYERYQERGGNHGRHFDDWLEAERELRTKK